MNLPLRIGSRSSPLAIVQVDEVIAALKAAGGNVAFEHKTFETAGDKDKTTPLTSNPGDYFFTDAIDQSLLKDEIDIAVHSAKDLPKHLPEGLEIIALTEILDDKDAWVGSYAWNALPKEARVGTSSQLRQSQVLSMRPDLTIVDIRGTINERLQLVKDGKVGGVIVAACALKRLKLAHEIKDILPWEGMALQGQLAVVAKAHDYHLKNLFKAIDVRRRYGKVVLVGAGPGDPELITVKGIKALEGADCVFYDYLADPSLLKHAPQAEHIYAGKRKGDHTLVQGELNRLLKEKAFAGKRVIRLKGGDPLVFGRGAEEIEYLSSYHVEVDVIPGVSSATGIPSLLGMPLTARGTSSSVAFVSAHGEGESASHKPVEIPKADTLVFLMGLTKIKEIIKGLKESNWNKLTPVLIVSKGTRLDQKVLIGTVESIESLLIQSPMLPPAIIIVGKTIDLYHPSVKKTFLHCGTHPDLYTYLGKIIHFPVIDIKPIQFVGFERELLLKELEAADILLFTSRYAVQCFVKPLLSSNRSLDLAGKIIASIGQHTAKTLGEFGINANIVALDETAEGLFTILTKEIDVSGMQILFPRSSIPNPFLKESLTAKGARVVEVPVYENSKPSKRELPAMPIDGIIFTSPSTVRNFLSDYGTIPNSWVIIAKGPVTALQLREAGYNKFISEH